MKTYRVTVRHDHGRMTLRVNADSEEGALVKMMNVEGCPGCAITKIVEIREVGHRAPQATEDQPK